MTGIQQEDDRGRPSTGSLQQWMSSKDTFQAVAWSAVGAILGWLAFEISGTTLPVLKSVVLFSGLLALLLWSVLNSLKTGKTLQPSGRTMRWVGRKDSPGQFWFFMVFKCVGAALMLIIILTALYPTHFQFVIRALRYSPYARGS